MQLKIIIDCDNESFENDTEGEVSRILKDIAEKIITKGIYNVNSALDYNGNTTVAIFVIG